MSLIAHNTRSMTRRFWFGLPWVIQFKSSMYTLSFCILAGDAASTGCTEYNPAIGKYNTYGLVDSVMYKFITSVAISEAVQNRSGKLAQSMGRTRSMQRRGFGSEAIRGTAYTKAPTLGVRRGQR